MEALPGDPEVVEEMPEEVRVDHSDRRTAHHQHVELGNLALQGDGGDQADASGTEDEDEDVFGSEGWTLKGHSQYPNANHPPRESICVPVKCGA
jgi:hypothetical protein